MESIKQIHYQPICGMSSTEIIELSEILTENDEHVR